MSDATVEAIVVVALFATCLVGAYCLPTHRELLVTAGVGVVTHWLGQLRERAKHVPPKRRR